MMSLAINNPARAYPTLVQTWTDLIACPGDLFESLREARLPTLHWLLPVLLTILLSTTFQLADTKLSAADQLNILAITAVSNAFGVMWSATILFLIARVLFKAPFQFSQAVGISGLAQLVAALALIITHLLSIATHDSFARPALSLLLTSFDATNRFHVALGTLNMMHFWLAGILAIGLAKTIRVSFWDAAFWVLGYWIGLRTVLALLGAGTTVL
jgi:hypothetical protein